jgi:ABC-type glutathione transport system ATPase component
MLILAVLFFCVKELIYVIKMLREGAEFMRIDYDLEVEGVIKQKPIVNLVGLGKVFRGKNNEVKALDDINLTIYEGEIFGIIGLSGAGKSTLVRCINFLERPTSGTIGAIPSLSVTTSRIPSGRPMR